MVVGVLGSHGVCALLGREPEPGPVIRQLLSMGELLAQDSLWVGTPLVHVRRLKQLISGLSFWEIVSILFIPADGNWGNWGSRGTCSTTTGQKVRQRACDNPRKFNGGADCPGRSQESTTCRGINN